MTSSSSTKIQLFEPIDGVDPVNRVTIGFPAQQPDRFRARRRRGRKRDRHGAANVPEIPEHRLDSEEISIRTGAFPGGSK